MQKQKNQLVLYPYSTHSDSVGESRAMIPDSQQNTPWHRCHTLTYVVSGNNNYRDVVRVSKSSLLLRIRVEEDRPYKL